MDPIEQAESAGESASIKKDRAALGWFTAGTLMGALVAVGAMLIINAARTPSPKAATAAAEVALDDERPFAPKVLARPANTQGPEAAPVTIIEYSDFNCGFCRRFHDETFQRVIDDYVKTGKARFSYKHYPFLTDSSPWKAEAAECAAEQGRFWDYHAMLFDSNIPNSGDQAAIRQQLVDAASGLKLDAQAFQACMEAGAVRQRVDADASEGQRLGVTGTPSFLINGKPLVGAQPYDAFKQAIDAALAEAAP